MSKSAGILLLLCQLFASYAYADSEKCCTFYAATGRTIGKSSEFSSDAGSSRFALELHSPLKSWETSVLYLAGGAAFDRGLLREDIGSLSADTRVNMHSTYLKPILCYKTMEVMSLCSGLSVGYNSYAQRGSGEYSTNLGAEIGPRVEVSDLNFLELKLFASSGINSTSVPSLGKVSQFGVLLGLGMRTAK